MKVFISWSGELSRLMAEELRSWLPTILQAVTPWVSSQDIRTGSRWLAELSSELDQTNFGILCVTAEALQSPWLNFEAGALGKRITDPKTGVVGLLFGVNHGAVSGPISQFQNVEFARDGMFKVAKDINLRISPPLAEALVTKLFDKFWEDLHGAYKRNLSETQKSATVAPKRSDRELLEELLARVRNQEEKIQRLSWMPTESPTKELANRLLAVIENASSLEDLSRSLGQSTYATSEERMQSFSELGLPPQISAHLVRRIQTRTRDFIEQTGPV
jgi:hypothetical protein